MAMIWSVVLTFCKFVQVLFVLEYGFRQGKWSAGIVFEVLYGQMHQMKRIGLWPIIVA